jgi:cupin 2 domain-containing protein
MILKNIFKKIPESIPEELVDIISETKEVRIERIVSKGHTSPSGFWYDQDRNEYVLLLKGSAGLFFEGAQEALVMHPGDYVDIPAHARHRVEWTDPDQETVWMAVHYLNNKGL